MNSGYRGSLTVTGREADFGRSRVPVVEGTGDFAGATGVLISTPIPQGKNGILFRQRIVLKRDKN